MKNQESVSQKNILVVDDVAEICSLLSEFLRDRGYGVDAAGTIGQARELLSANNYAMVITNLYLGEKSSADGLQVVELAKKLAPSASVILMSGGASPETWAQLTHFKVQGLLRKPFTLETLYKTVRDAMAKAALMRSPQPS